jgi:hypothetical protein
MIKHLFTTARTSSPRVPVHRKVFKTKPGATPYAVSQELRPARLERATYGSGGRRSIQLNYGREWIPNITQFNELAIQGYGGYPVGEPPTCEIAK